MELELKLRIECRENVEPGSIGGPANYDYELEDKFIVPFLGMVSLDYWVTLDD